MAKKKIYKTTVTVHILSEEPVPENITLEQLDAESYDGMYISSQLEFKEKILIGKTAVAEVVKYDSAPEFLNMDSEGNDISEPETDD